jgi:DNA polymerase III subunit epsilon
MARFVALDTETTGFSPRHHRILEFGAVEVTPRTGSLGAELRHLINPGGPIPSSSTAVHGIRAEDVEGKPAFRDVAGEIAAFIAGATLIIQNAEFDVGMLDAEFARAGHAAVAEVVSRVVDLMDVTEGVHPFMPTRTLDAVCEHYGVSLADRTMHGALLDSKLMAETLPHLARDYDEWKAIEEARCAEEVTEFCRQLDAYTDANIAAVDTSTAEKAEGSATRLAAVSKAVSKLKKGFDESLDALLAADAQWYCKHYAAHWRSSSRTSWKDVTTAYLSPTDLLPYTKESISSTYTPEADRNVIADGEKLSLIVAEDAIAKSISCVLRALTALKSADKRIDKAREAVRTDVLGAVANGYVLKHGNVRTSTRKTVGYKDACEDRCPDADTSEFKSTSSSISVFTRDSAACEVLFA